MSGLLRFFFSTPSESFTHLQKGVCQRLGQNGLLWYYTSCLLVYPRAQSWGCSKSQNGMSRKRQTIQRLIENLIERTYKSTLLQDFGVAASFVCTCAFGTQYRHIGLVDTADSTARYCVSAIKLHRTVFVVIKTIPTVQDAYMLYTCTRITKH